jgi:hypothetical protein
MTLTLTFQKGEITGSGSDWIGEFAVQGRYDVESGKCQFAKLYKGKYDVYYQGFNEGKGIWGKWETPPVIEPALQRGGFHIWPQGMASEDMDAIKSA